MRLLLITAESVCESDEWVGQGGNHISAEKHRGRKLHCLAGAENITIASSSDVLYCKDLKSDSEFTQWGIIIGNAICWYVYRVPWVVRGVGGLYAGDNAWSVDDVETYFKDLFDWENHSQWY